MKHSLLFKCNKLTSPTAHSVYIYIMYNVIIIIICLTVINIILLFKLVRAYHFTLETRCHFISIRSYDADKIKPSIYLQ